MLINGDDDITLEADSTTPRVLTVLSFVLERIVARNDQVGSNPIEPLMESGKGLSVFHGVRAPNISIFKYLERIYKYVSCSPSCFVVGFVYIDRLMHKHPDSLVLSLNVHRLIVTSVMVASKVLDDDYRGQWNLKSIKTRLPIDVDCVLTCLDGNPSKQGSAGPTVMHYNNAFYARVGGISNAELNRLELELLFLLDFGVTVSSRVFESYCLHLEKEMMWSGVGQRIEQSMSNPPDDETEISAGDTQQSSSPPPHVID